MSWTDQTTVTVTEDHLKLARRMNVSWDHCEFGAPSIDPKRPYGNSDVIDDIGEILGVATIRCPNCEEKIVDPNFEAKAARLHHEMKDVLQVWLATGRICTGIFRSPEQSSEWEYVGPLPEEEIPKKLVSGIQKLAVSLPPGLAPKEL